MHSYDSDGPSTVYLHFLSVRLREKKKRFPTALQRRHNLLSDSAPYIDSGNTTNAVTDNLIKVNNSS